MKQICFSLIFIFCLGCSNDNGDDDSILGTWQLEATRISDGGSVGWTSVQFTATYQFKSDDSFIFSIDGNFGNDQTGTFTIEDGRLTLDAVDATGNTEQIVYGFTVNGGKLTLDFVDCTETCSQRYKRT